MATIGFTRADGSFIEDMNQLCILLNKEITEAGTYTIEIPENVIWSNDDPENLWNKATTLTYTVDPTSVGIDNVETGNVTEVDVYSVDGALFAKGVKSNELKTLPAGVYVVNGRKIAIR